MSSAAYSSTSAAAPAAAALPASLSVTPVTADLLRLFEPLSSLGESRLREFSTLCYVERVSLGMDPFRVKSNIEQLVYLVAGSLQLTEANGQVLAIEAKTAAARYPVGQGRTIAEACALSDCELMRIDQDLFDIMVTWDELAAFDATKTGRFSALDGDTTLGPRVPANWNVMSGVFSVASLRNGAWSQLPTAHIGELLNRFVRVEVRAAQVLIREGEEGDYYYVLEAGRAQVSRTVGGVTVVLADLKSGDAFGEEALVSEAKRNATVAMRSDGVVLRLGKADFVSLLKQPLLQRVSLASAEGAVAAGAAWLDVRYPSEYQYDRLAGAVNVPLSEIRNAFNVLDKSKSYVVYCQSGRRSSAAAFLLAQRGFKVSVLEGGLWAYKR